MLDIKATDCSWAKVHFSDRAELEAAYEELQADLRHARKHNPEKVSELETIEEELVDLLLADMFDLL